MRERPAVTMQNLSRSTMKDTQSPTQNQISFFQKRRDIYQTVVGGLPPNIDNATELAEARKLLAEDIRHAKSFVTKNSTHTDGKLLLADLLRMAHNVDLPNAAKESEQCLQAILQDDPNHAEAVFCLASLYVNLHLDFMPQAERYFLHALALTKDQPNPLIYQGLGFACLHLQKREQAMIYFHEYLRRTPNDNRIAELVAELSSGKPAESVRIPITKPWWKFW